VPGQEFLAVGDDILIFVRNDEILWLPRRAFSSANHVDAFLETARRLHADALKPRWKERRITFEQYPLLGEIIEARIMALGDRGEIGLTQHPPMDEKGWCKRRRSIAERADKAYSLDEPEPQFVGGTEMRIARRHHKCSPLLSWVLVSVALLSIMPGSSLAKDEKAAALPASVERFVRWLPEDTETLFVARSTTLFDFTPDDLEKVQWQDVGLGLACGGLVLNGEKTFRT
jgi:hypothetical protein